MNKNQLQSIVVKFSFMLTGLIVCGCSLGSLIIEDIKGDMEEKKVQYYVNPLPEKEWYDENVLDYSHGHFSFPPPAGYRIMRYSKKNEKGGRGNVGVDLFREVIDADTSFAKLIKRRQGSDHCQFAGEEYQKKKDIDLVGVEADCYRWQSGEFKRKYYFIKDKSIVYTFRMSSSLEEYDAMASDFDHFVDYTITNYLQYPGEAEKVSSQQIKDEQLDPELFSIFHPKKKDSFLQSQEK